MKGLLVGIWLVRVDLRLQLRCRLRKWAPREGNGRGLRRKGMSSEGELLSHPGTHGVGCVRSSFYYHRGRPS